MVELVFFSYCFDKTQFKDPEKGAGITKNLMLKQWDINGGQRGGGKLMLRGADGQIN